MTYVRTHLEEASAIIARLDIESVESLVSELALLRERGGRLFLLGVGGSAANCSHAASDFRKLAGIEAYAATDNVSELTARANDDGWPTIFVEWLKVSRLGVNDGIFVFSVGGGSLEHNISTNLVHALDHAKSVGARIFGVVGRDGGHTAKIGDAVVLVPMVNPATVTPHAETIQALVWHLLVSHPALKVRSTKWEAVAH